MLEKYRDTIESCTLCHDQCVFACPTFTIERKTTVYPSRKAQIARCLLTGEVDWDRDSAELFYHCCGCRQCRTWCVHMKDPKDPPPIYHAARYDELKHGVVLDFVAEAEKRYEKYGNLYGDLSRIWHEVQKSNSSSSRSDLLYFVDTETLALNPEATRSAIALMKNRGIALEISERFETGFDAKTCGFFEEAEKSARETAAYLNAHGAEKIVVSNPKCFHALTVWYKELGLEIRKKVELETSYLYDILIVDHKEVKQRPFDVLHFLMTDKRATYQDGSYMARYIMDFERPRRLIKPLFSYFAEMRMNREQSVPVAPANYPLGIAESTLEGMAKIRIVDLENSNADIVVTSDPLSNAAFKKYWHAERVLSVPEALLMNYSKQGDVREKLGRIY